MSFTSLSFFVFLAAVLPLYYLLPRKCQPTVLLVASIWFAGTAGWQTTVVLLAEILVAWGAGLVIDAVPKEKRRWALLGGVIVLVGILLVLKYSGMLFGIIEQLPGVQFDQLPQPVAALGLSYYTLMAVGYLADVSRGKIQPVRSLLQVALFLSFFPQFTSGPIGRADELLPQLTASRNFVYEDFATGATRMLWGAFKKLVVADSLAMVVDPVFETPTAFSGPVVLLGALAYSYQLYCDFSGYTDMACGVAGLFSIRLRENFRRPFASRSYGELWNRWHMSLSLWFRDYVYFPLGGSRRGVLRMCIATMTVFTVSGVWHDVGWLFLVWGGLCGVFVTAEKLMAPGLNALAGRIPGYRGSVVQRLWQLVRVYLIFTACFIVFRVGSNANAGLAECFRFYRQLLIGWDVLLAPSQLVPQLKALSIGRKLVAYLSTSILLTEGVDFLAGRSGLNAAVWLRSLRPLPRLSLYYLLALMILFFGQLGSSTFIYFQF